MFYHISQNADRKPSQIMHREREDGKRRRGGRNAGGRVGGGGIKNDINSFVTLILQETEKERSHKYCKVEKGRQKRNNRRRRRLKCGGGEN